MYRFYLATVDMLPGVLILAPVYWVLNRAYFHNIRRSCFYFVFSCYLSVVYVLVGMPNVTYMRPEINLNLIPVIGMIEDWKNSILNVLLFIPLGALLPILWNRFRKAKHTVLFCLGTSLIIELLQMLTFRATDVNDLITNTLGAYLGFLFSTRLFKKHQLSKDDKPGDVGIVIAFVLLVMFFIYPFVSAALWDLLLA